MFLSNVVEELCGSDAGKVRATTRRGLAGEKEDPSAAASTSKSFVLQRLCSHAKCSHLVQKIMQIATPDQVAMFLTALQDKSEPTAARGTGARASKQASSVLGDPYANRIASLSTVLRDLLLSLSSTPQRGRGVLGPLRLARA